MAAKNNFNVLIICTSNQDRSPALLEYFKNTYPEHQYKSAGINNYYCKKKGNHYLTHDDIRWSDLILFAENIHKQVFKRDFGDIVSGGYISDDMDCHKRPSVYKIGWRILNCGEYKQGCIGDDYIMKADIIFKEAIN